MGGALFWVGGGGWENTLGEWRWVGMSGSEWVGALFDNALSKYIFYVTLT